MKVCVWKNDTDGNWYPACCDEIFIFNDGGPVENNFNHCPYCGRELGQLIWSPEEEIHGH